MKATSISVVRISTVSIGRSGHSIDRRSGARYRLGVKKFLPVLAAIALGACATTVPTPAERLAAVYPTERPFPDSRFATFGGVTVHYRIWEPASETRGKIVFLHAAGGSTVSFRQIAPLLAEAGFAVVAADLPGFGFSDLALELEHSLSIRAGLIWSLADRLDTEQNAFSPAGRWIIAGHGMGGQVALQMAIERPARASGVVLLASDVVNEVNPGRGMWFPPVRWAIRSWLENSLYTIDGVTELLGEAYGRPPTEQEVDLYAAPVLRPNMPRAYVRYARTAGRTTFDLEAIETPTLVVWGELDVTVDPELGALAAERLPRGALVLIPGAAHLAMETHAAETADAILGWASAR